MEHAAAGLFADPGVGKTSAVLAAFMWLRKRGLARRMLVVAPMRVCHLVWPAEMERWADFHDLRLEILHGPGKDAALARSADVYVINPEGLDWLLRATKKTGLSGRTSVTVDVGRFKALGFDLLVVDELTKFKNTQGVRYKTLKAVLPTFGRRWGLTGLPSPNGLIDLFGGCYVLDLGKALGPYVTHYRSNFFDPNHDGTKWLLRAGAAEQIYERIAPLVLRLAAEDYVDMPTVSENYIRVTLPPPARAVYGRMEDHLIVRLQKGIVTAANAGAAGTKCHQIANGAVYLDEEVIDALGSKNRGDGREWADVHSAKLEALADLVEELGGSPVLVAYHFEHDLARLKARLGNLLGEVPPHLGGGVSTQRAKEVEAAWNRGEIPVLLGHPASVGHGLNLQRSSNHVCWFSLTWDYDLYDQFTRRVRRQGSKFSRVFVHHIVASGTIDESMIGALCAKRRGQDALFQGLLEIARRRGKIISASPQRGRGSSA